MKRVIFLIVVTFFVTIDVNAQPHSSLVVGLRTTELTPAQIKCVPQAYNLAKDVLYEVRAYHKSSIARSRSAIVDVYFFELGDEGSHPQLNFESDGVVSARIPVVVQANGKCRLPEPDQLKQAYYLVFE